MLQRKDTENLGLVPFIPCYCFIAAPAQSRLIPLSQIITRSPGQQRLSSSSKLSVITLMPGLFLWVPRALCVLSPPAKAGQQQLSLCLPVAGGQGPAWAGPGACLGRARPLSGARHPEDFWAAQLPHLQNTQSLAGRGLLDVIQCCCLLRLQEFVFGLCLLAATASPTISTGLQKRPLRSYQPAARVVAANHPCGKGSSTLLQLARDCQHLEELS